MFIKHVATQGRNERGQAYAEFAISVGFMVAALMFAVAVSRFGALNERVQTSVRYASFVGESQDPFTYASGTSLYKSLKNTIRPAQQSDCVSPDGGVLAGQGPFLNSGDAQFWLPNGIARPVCSHNFVRLPMVAGSGADLLVERLDYSLDADASGYSTWLTDFGVDGKRTVKASVSIYHAPAMTVLLHCYKNLGTVVNDAIYPPDISSGDSSLPDEISGSSISGARNNFAVEPTTCQDLVNASGPPTSPNSPVPSEKPLPQRTPQPTATPPPNGTQGTPGPSGPPGLPPQTDAPPGNPGPGGGAGDPSPQATMATSAPTQPPEPDPTDPPDTSSGSKSGFDLKTDDA